MTDFQISIVNAGDACDACICKTSENIFTNTEMHLELLGSFY